MVCLLLASCAQRPLPVETYAQVRERVDRERYFNISAATRDLAENVGQLRRLRVKRSIYSSYLQPEAFLKQLRNHTPSPSVEQERIIRARRTAFGLPQPLEKSEQDRRGPLPDSLLGFYDQDGERIYVRTKFKLLRPDFDEMDLTVVHETAHALQHQHFGNDLFRTRPTDESLALRALIEGDATATTVAYAGWKLAAPTREAIEHTRGLALIPISETPDRDPDLPSREDTFVYLDGLRFAAELYRVGGFALLDKTMRSPPISTEQVLHPQKYLSGERPIEVPAPEAPTGYVRIESGTMGELGIGIVLSQCAKEDETGATDWGGDVFLLAESDRHDLILEWNTVWDSDDAALRFEKAIRHAASCWTSKAGASLSISPEFTIARDHNRVAVVRGMHDEEGQIQAQRLLKMPTMPNRRAASGQSR